MFRSICAVLLCVIFIVSVAITAFATESGEEYAAVIITGSSVNIRSGPSTDYEVVGKAYSGNQFTYITEDSSSGTVWYKVVVSGSSVGWVSGKYSSRITVSSDGVQSQINSIAAAYGTVGLQAAVIENGTVTRTYNFGYAVKSSTPMTSDHKIRVASLSKVAIAMMAMKLQENGTVGIEKNIGGWWNATLPKPVTIKSLLSHTSTLSDLSYKYTQSETRAQLVSSGSYTSGTVGSRSVWRYNNYGAGIAGSTLEMAAGTTLDKLGKSELFTPLGMDASWYSGSVSNTNKLAALYYADDSVSRSVSAAKNIVGSSSVGCNTAYFAGGLTVSAQDYAKLIAVLANDGTYNGERYLTAESVAAIESHLFTASENGGSFTQCMPLRYKENLYGQSELYYHTGNAYGVLALASYNPSTRNGVVVVTTGAQATRDSQGVYAVCSSVTKYLYDTIGSGASNEPTTTTTTTTTAATTTTTTAPSALYPAESIALSPSQLTLRIGESADISAVLDPADADDTIKWSSSSGCVRVENGRVTAVAHGSATVTAKGQNVSGTCTVNVVPELDFTMLGASIRLSDPYGIRFGVSLRKDAEFEKCDIVEYGTLIIGSGTLGDAELVMDTPNVRRIKADSVYSENSSQLVYTGVLTKIPQSFFATNVTARGYLIYKDCDGVMNVIYTDTVQKSFNGVASAAYESYAAIENPGESDKNMLNKLTELLDK